MAEGWFVVAPGHFPYWVDFSAKAYDMLLGVW